MTRQQDVGAELTALEKQYWHAIQDKDTKVANSLSDDPCVVVGARGVAEIDKKTLAGMLEGAKYELSKFQFEDVHVRPVAKDVVIVAYKVKEDILVDGEKVALEAFDSSVWVHRDDKWVCALHTETPKGDPYGRQGRQSRLGKH